MREDLYIRDGVEAHLNVAQSLNTLANILTKKAELSKLAKPILSREFLEEAVRLLRKSLEMRRKLYIKNGVTAHKSVANALHSLHLALKRTEGQTEETDALYNEFDEMMSILLSMRAKENPDVATSF